MNCFDCYFEVKNDGFEGSEVRAVWNGKRSRHLEMRGSEFRPLLPRPVWPQAQSFIAPRLRESSLENEEACKGGFLLPIVVKRP